jgi:RNA-directed DNA polymerase
MRDTEKSDFGIVAMKPTNKAGRPVAELVEPRPGTKGNEEQQSTHRARVSQALGRVRKAARLKKKERFTALFHHILLYSGAGKQGNN